MSLTTVLLLAMTAAGLFTAAVVLLKSTRSAGSNGAPALLQALVGAGSIAPLGPVGYAFPVGAPLALLAGVMAPRRSPSPRASRVLLVVTVLGAVGFVVSAYVSGTEIARLGFLSFIAFGVYFFVGSRVAGDTAGVARTLAWTAGSSVVFYLLIGTENTSGSLAHLWKYGIGVPLAFMALYAVRNWTTVLPALFVLTAMGVVAVVLGFRSQGLTCFVAGVLILVRLRAPRRRGAGRTGRHRSAVRYGAAALLVLVTAQLLATGIENGLFGEGVRQRTLEQSAAGASPLLAGRVEPPLSLAAIAEHPLLGWGDADAIDSTTISSGAQLAGRLGLTDPSAYLHLWIRDGREISLHSVFFEAWVEGGILAVVLPLTALVVLVRAAFRASGPFGPFTILVAVQGVWDLLFSTWGFNRAPILALSVLLAMHASRATEDGTPVGPPILGQLEHEPGTAPVSGAP